MFAGALKYVLGEFFFFFFWDVWVVKLAKKKNTIPYNGFYIEIGICKTWGRTLDFSDLKAITVR